MPFYQRWALFVAGWTVPWLTVTAPDGLEIWPSDNVEMLRALSRDPLVIKRTRIDALYGLTTLMDEAMAAMGRISVPTLVLFGANEQVIPPEPVAQALARLPPGPRVVRYPRGWHMLLRDLNAPVVWRDVAAWVSDPAAALPSGAEITASLRDQVAAPDRAR
jgi:pimeloyl-ACP methyl ester carboxylesterase